MRSTLRRLLHPLKEFGWIGGALYILDRLMGQLSPSLGLYVYDLMVQPITSTPLLPARMARNLTFAEIQSCDPAFERIQARPEIKASRIDQGARCLGVFRKEVLLGYVWFCFNCYDEDEVRLRYCLTEDKQSVFDFDLYVFPEQRMGIAFAAIWHAANEYLHACGVRYTFSRITHFNLASRHAHDRLGAKPTGRTTVLKAGRFELMLASIPPYFSVSCSPKRRVELRLTSDVVDVKG